VKRFGAYLLAGLLGVGAGYFLGANLGRGAGADLSACQAERDEAVSSEAALQRQVDDCKARAAR
jgi:hypothetical protein